LISRSINSTFALIGLLVSASTILPFTYVTGPGFNLSSSSNLYISSPPKPSNLSDAKYPYLPLVEIYIPNSKPDEFTGYPKLTGFPHSAFSFFLDRKKS